MSNLVPQILTYQQTRGGAHHAGTLTVAPLDRIVWYFENYFKGKRVKSVETGCGASTIIFSHYSEHHTVYCYDDRMEKNSSVNFALEYPNFSTDRVKWIFGPTQRTMFKEPLDQDVDIILIDGPHGYPFPELEYFSFYSRLKHGGILIIDDIHIPTINNLYKFLLQDDSFYSHGVTATTAYFQRSDRPSFDMEGDGWNHQRRNVQGFPAANHIDVDVGYALPIVHSFDGKLASACSLLARGFSEHNGIAVTEGDLSLIELKVASRLPEKLKIIFDIEPICIENRAARKPGVTVVVCGKKVGAIDFDNSERRTIEIEAQTNGEKAVRIEFWHRGTVIANELSSWPRSAWVWYDGRLLNFYLHSIAVHDATELNKPVNNVARVDGSVVSFDYGNQRINFFVDEVQDVIGSFHAHGRFYEHEELEVIRRFVPPKSRVLDIGAHVGNHSVFFSKILNAEKVVAVEPNLRAQNSLRINCILNGVSTIDLSRVNHALADKSGRGRIVAAEKFNSGAVTVERSEEGPVRLIRGDDLFSDEDFHFVKIDVEGMELEVIDGLRNLLLRKKPTLLVDSKRENSAKVVKLVHELGYAISWQSQDYSNRILYLMINIPASVLVNTETKKA